MAAVLEINGKKLVTIKEAARTVSYSRDYITRLAREGKIVATHIGRHWYLDIASLKNYEEISQAEQNIKKRQLSDERKRDLQVKEALRLRTAAQQKRAQHTGRVAASVASFVLLAGLTTGVWLNHEFGIQLTSDRQLANVSTVDRSSVTTAATMQDDSDGIQPLFEKDFRVRTLDEVSTGILLLPQSRLEGADNVQSIEHYFSDPVRVVVNEEGRAMVVVTDELGNELTEPVPFITVPVNHEKQ